MSHLNWSGDINAYGGDLSLPWVVADCIVRLLYTSCWTVSQVLWLISFILFLCVYLPILSKA